MKIGIFGGTVNDGTIDDMVAEARSAEEMVLLVIGRHRSLDMTH